jgi:hypothetical protein
VSADVDRHVAWSDEPAKLVDRRLRDPLPALTRVEPLRILDPAVEG